MIEDEITCFYYFTVEQKSIFTDDKLYFYRNENIKQNNEELLTNLYNSLKYLVENKEYKKLQKFLLVFKIFFKIVIETEEVEDLNNDLIMMIKKQQKNKLKNILKNIKLL